MPTIRTRPENLPTGLLLAGAGGFLDAYTFIGRGGVFANAQTGNIVLLAAAAGERHWPTALLHVPPILAFMLGVALAETLARPTARRIVRRPARFVLVAEIVVLLIVGALPPQVPDQVVTAAIAFTSALQVDVPVAAGHRLQHDAHDEQPAHPGRPGLPLARGSRCNGSAAGGAGRGGSRGLRRRRGCGSPMHPSLWSSCGLGGGRWLAPCRAGLKRQPRPAGAGINP